MTRSFFIKQLNFNFCRLSVTMLLPRRLLLRSRYQYPLITINIEQPSTNKIWKNISCLRVYCVFSYDNNNTPNRVWPWVCSSSHRCLMCLMSPKHQVWACDQCSAPRLLSSIFAPQLPVTMSPNKVLNLSSRQIHWRKTMLVLFTCSRLLRSFHVLNTSGWQTCVIPSQTNLSVYIRLKIFLIAWNNKLLSLQIP